MRYLFGLFCILISPFIMLGIAFPTLIKMMWEDTRRSRRDTTVSQDDTEQW